MTCIPRSPRRPIVSRTALPVPGQVLFKRFLSERSVCGVCVPASCVALSAGASPSPPRCVASTPKACVSPKSASRVSASSASVSVASKVLSRSAYVSSLRVMAPQGVLSSAFRALRKVAMAAKVERGRQRLGVETRVLSAWSPSARAFEVSRFAFVRSSVPGDARVGTHGRDPPWLSS